MHETSTTSGGYFVMSFINAVQAHYMNLKDSLELKKKVLLVLFKIQNG
jgi:hypothetical protein